MTGPASVADTQMPLDEAAVAQPEAPNLGEVKLEGDGIPEELRGKPVTEALAYANKLKEALRISEEARATAQNQFQLAMRQPAPIAAAPAPVEEELTDEQLSELHQLDPIKFTNYLTQRAIKQAERNLEARLGPMLQGTATTAENMAKQNYATEFQLFGDQIDGLISSIPGGKQAMTNPGAWDDLVALVRGRKGNWEKFLDHQASQTVVKQQAAAQQQQREVAGLAATSSVRGAIPTNVAQLDPTQLEIADKLGLTPQEYVNWSKQ